jgi:hypothetical protein
MRIEVGQLSIGLVSAGGLVTCGLVIGYLRSVLVNACWYITIAVFSPGVIATGPDYVREERPVADTLDDAEGLITEGFADKRFEITFFPALKKRLESLPPFWRDTSLTVKPRSFYFDRDRDIGDSVAWAAGGSVQHQSGWWKDRLRIATTLYTSQKLYGPGDKDETLLLKPGQQSFTVLGEAYMEVRLTEWSNARAGRTAIDLPYLNRQDSRMVPNTFLAYGVDGNVNGKLVFVAGQVTHMKRRNSDNFEPMSKAAGLRGTDEPASVAGMLYNFTDSINVGFINLHAWEFMNIFYSEGNSAWQASDDLALGLSAQFTDQRSVGDELDGDFETRVFGAKASATYKGATLSAAFSSTDNDSRIRSPFGSYPGYLSLMVKDFNRAGEDAWLVGLAYDFAEIGWQGISAFANYAEGYTPDSDSTGAADQKELDLTLDIRPTSAFLDGLWLRLRHARVDQDGRFADDVRDWRVILNYELPLL